MHDQLEAGREPEPVDAETVHQMARALECECSKRGMTFGGGNHDIIPQLLGIDPLERELYKKGLKVPTEEMKSKMALINGKRELFKNDPFNTNFCMSRADLRKKYVDIVVDMAKKNPHYRNIACCLADLRRNHCECEECQKLHPTDFLVMIVNDIDEIFTREGISTKLYDRIAAPTILWSINTYSWQTNEFEKNIFKSMITGSGRISGNMYMAHEATYVKKIFIDEEPVKLVLPYTPTGDKLPDYDRMYNEIYAKEHEND
jgi:hypothetical protein